MPHSTVEDNYCSNHEHHQHEHGQTMAGDGGAAADSVRGSSKFGRLPNGAVQQQDMVGGGLSISSSEQQQEEDYQLQPRQPHISEAVGTAAGLSLVYNGPDGQIDRGSTPMMALRTASYPSAPRLPLQPSSLPLHPSALSSHAGALPLHASALTSNAGALQPHAGALPPHAGVLPSHAGALPPQPSSLVQHYPANQMAPVTDGDGRRYHMVHDINLLDYTSIMDFDVLFCENAPHYAFHSRFDAMEVGQRVAKRLGWHLRTKTSRGEGTPVEQAYVCCSYQGLNGSRSKRRASTAASTSAEENGATETSAEVLTKETNATVTADINDDTTTKNGTNTEGVDATSTEDMGPTSTEATNLTSPTSTAAQAKRTRQALRCGCLWSCKLTGVVLPLLQRWRRGRNIRHKLENGLDKGAHPVIWRFHGPEQYTTHNHDVMTPPSYGPASALETQAASVPPNWTSDGTSSGAVAGRHALGPALVGRKPPQPVHYLRQQSAHPDDDFYQQQIMPPSVYPSSMPPHPYVSGNAVGVYRQGGHGHPARYSGPNGAVDGFVDIIDGGEYATWRYGGGASAAYNMHPQRMYNAHTAPTSEQSIPLTMPARPIGAAPMPPWSMTIPATRVTQGIEHMPPGQLSHPPPSAISRHSGHFQSLSQPPSFSSYMVPSSHLQRMSSMEIAEESRQEESRLRLLAPVKMEKPLATDCERITLRPLQINPIISATKRKTWTTSGADIYVGQPVVAVAHDLASRSWASVQLMEPTLPVCSFNPNVLAVAHSDGHHGRATIVEAPDVVGNDASAAENVK